MDVNGHKGAHRTVSYGIVRDEVILLVRLQEQGPEELMRRIEVEAEDGGTVVFVTNHRKLSAAAVAAVYRQRWQIELWFKALKQTLRIKTFVGTSANAVLIQIWTAWIAMLLVKYLRMRSRYGWRLSNRVALLRQQRLSTGTCSGGWITRSSRRRSGLGSNNWSWSESDLDSRRDLPQGAGLIISPAPSAKAFGFSLSKTGQTLIWTAMGLVSS